jgi:hypothetical protein
MENETYNGWVNRESWCVKLHWDNNKGDYTYLTEEAKKQKKQGLEVFKFADFLKDYAEDIFHSVIFDGIGTGEAKLFVADVGSLWRVDWIEIAEAYYKEVEE